MRLTPGRLALLGVVIAAVTIAGYILLLDYTAIRNRPWLYVAGLAVATAAAVASVTRRRSAGTLTALVVCTLVLGAATFFNFVAARVPAPTSALRVGERAPEFTLGDARGRPVSLADYRGRKPVVLVFYRGYW
jgi:cytochrome oxidase Cu insertion factor (SCO1/SenC/PrrC family)